MTRTAWKIPATTVALALIASTAPVASADEPALVSACPIVNSDSCTTGVHTYPNSGGFIGLFQGTLWINATWGPPSDVRVSTYACTGLFTGQWNIDAQCTLSGSWPNNGIPYVGTCESKGVGSGVCVIYQGTII